MKTNFFEKCKNVFRKLKLTDESGNWHIVEKKRIWFLFPLVVILVAIVVFSIFAGISGDASQGINLGLDFTGGTVMTVYLDRDEITNNYDENVNKITSIIESQGFSVSYTQVTTSSSSGTQGIMFRYKNLSDETESNAKNDLIVEEIRQVYNVPVTANANFVTSEFIGSTASSELIGSAMLAIFVSCLLILIYVVIRFTIWSGISAIIALLHDVFMMIAFTIIFHIQVNTSFIAAIVTIIAYSINNTIVIFDRVREKTRENKLVTTKLDTAQLTNSAIKETFVRSINTSFTTLITITILAIVGVASIQEFVLPIIIGLLCGTFSSLCIATSMYSILETSSQKRKILREQKTGVSNVDWREKLRTKFKSKKKQPVE